MATSISILREYLANRVFCQLLKVYQVKKRVHLQQFGIIHLPSLDLTYINNMREKQNYVYALPPLENLDHESFSILYFFTPSYRTWHVGRNTDANPDRRSHISVWGCEFCKVSIFFAKLVCQNV
jgi:hypothetical protein